MSGIAATLTLTSYHLEGGPKLQETKVVSSVEVRPISAQQQTSHSPPCPHTMPTTPLLLPPLRIHGNSQRDDPAHPMLAAPQERDARLPVV